MPELDHNGLRASYRVWGEGPRMVLLHAGGSHGGQWAKVAEALAVEITSIAPDLIGCGMTATWPIPGKLMQDDQADLVAAIVEATGGGPVDIVGHSYGGAVAVRLAVNRPELVRSLLVIEPILTCLLGEIGDPIFKEGEGVNRRFVAAIESGQPERGWQEFLDVRNGVGTWERMSDDRRRGFLAQTAQARDTLYSNLNNPTTLAECRSIGVPMTIACGETTTPADRRTTEVLREAVPAARYEIIPGAGHMSPLSHPQEVARLVRAHLERAR